MVYNFQLKGDNVSSKNVTNLPIAAIIYLLNEGQSSLIKKRYGGFNTTSHQSFEEIQKRRDEFQRILITNERVPAIADKTDKEIYVADISNGKTSQEYMFLARTNVSGIKGACKRRLKGILSQTDDLDITLDSPLESPSFEWGEVPFRMTQDNIQFMTDGTFQIKEAIIDYLRYPKEMSMAGYRKFDNTLSGDQNCEMPRFMHYDIVDEGILVFDLGLTQEMQAKLMKMQNNE